MLSDRDIAKLCHGRIIRANAYQSCGKDAAGEHWGIILNSDAEILDKDVYSVVMISRNTTIEPEHQLPVPAHTGLRGFIHCGWVPQVQLPGIICIGQKLHAPEMMQIIKKVWEAKAAKKAAAAKKGRSTGS